VNNTIKRFLQYLFNSLCDASLRSGNEALRKQLQNIHNNFFNNAVIFVISINLFDIMLKHRYTHDGVLCAAVYNNNDVFTEFYFP